MGKVSGRRARPGDAEALSHVFARPSVIPGTLQLPYPSMKFWRRHTSEPFGRAVSHAAVAEGGVIGELGPVV